MRNILVTGGAGFIGSHLVDRLLSEDEWKVSVVDDFNDFYDPAIKRANVSSHEKNPDYRLFEVDIRDYAARERIKGDFVIIPKSTLKSDEEIMLDGMKLEELSLKLGWPVHPLDMKSFGQFLFRHN